MDNKKEKNEEIKNIKEKSEKYIIDENNKINIKRINELELYIKNFKKKEYDNFLRYKAEIENIKKRSSIDIEKTYKFALENFSKDLLLIIDNLERSIKSLNKFNNKLISIFEGIELTLKSIINLINKYGIKIINNTNIQFDPIKHQAICSVKSDKFKSNFIINVVQNGYILHNRLLRPALVIVSI
ncbi:MAG: nucleotide exchange factor GrpE [Enterobacteriaceae bacterium PSpicST2]|nr:MAG: nucleotide exchange factor GrpE [Enterobacteriaceae bacterium PSpicST2]WMC19077.1 MAG: nucleotide exchange factor GrpE [Enterobacteriaceae bacterium PSpicST1]